MNVYFAQRASDGLVKIGHSTHYPKRLLTLGKKKDPLKLIRLTEGYREEEKKFHHHFRRWRVKGEWFRFVPSMLTWLPVGGLEIPLNELKPINLLVVTPALVHAIRRKAKEEGRQVLRELLRTLRERYLDKAERA